MPKKDQAKELAKAAREVLAEKKANDIIILDLRKLNAIADYFVICSATSTRHADALTDEAVFGLKQRGHKVLHTEGEGSGTWTLLDYGDVIVHVFYYETRAFYNLEKLWGDAPRVK
ncbi:MAG: ribosome silencing factor [Candidatus Omnitrophica bacterium]|nr:ribosome silencing factor [Candidatus Omnitrophota bacterium]